MRTVFKGNHKTKSLSNYRRIIAGGIGVFLFWFIASACNSMEKVELEGQVIVKVDGLGGLRIAKLRYNDLDPKTKRYKEFLRAVKLVAIKSGGIEYPLQEKSLDYITRFLFNNDKIIITVQRIGKKERVSNSIKARNGDELTIRYYLESFLIINRYRFEAWRRKNGGFIITKMEPLMSDNLNSRVTSIRPDEI